MATSKSTGSASPSRPLTSGTVTSRGFGLALFTAIGLYGPFNPETGFRYNPNKLLIGPYARAISGRIDLLGSGSLATRSKAPIPTAISSSTSATAPLTC